MARQWMLSGPASAAQSAGLYVCAVAALQSGSNSAVASHVRQADDADGMSGGREGVMRRIVGLGAETVNAASCTARHGARCDGKYQIYSCSRLPGKRKRPI